jgi:RimJ/RimL family protein N-acetyltransferase
VIRGELTNLRAIERPDAAALFQWFNHPLVMRFWGYGEGIVSLNRIQLDVEEWLEEEQAADRPAAMMIESLSGDALGVAILTEERRQDRAVELSLLIGEPHCWGKGFGSDALGVIVDACFAQWGLHRISARSEIGNERAHRWLRRAGFQLEGTLRDASFFDNAFHDQLLFSLLATDEETAQ